MSVITNYHSRPLVCAQDLTDAEWSNVDYVPRDDYAARFVRAFGNVYDVHDAEVVTVAPAYVPFGHNVSADSELAAWHAIAAESAWSATVFRLVTDDYGDECVIVGRYSVSHTELTMEEGE